MGDIISAITPSEDIVSIFDMTMLEGLELTRKELLSQGFDEATVNETIAILHNDYFNGRY